MITKPQTVNAPTPVFDVTEATFERDVLLRSREVPVVVDFWAPWCGPCRTLGPTLERLATEAKGSWLLAKLNTDEHQRIAAAFRIQSIPAVKAFREGKIAAEFVGALPEGQVRAWLKQLVGEPGDNALASIAAIEASDPQRAVALYRQLLEQDPKNVPAFFALGRLLFLQGDPEGMGLLKHVPTGTPQYAQAQALLPLSDFFAVLDEPEQSGDLETRYRRAARDLHARRYQEALDELLTLVAHDRSFRDDGARKALLGAFALLGDEHPLVPQYRRKLANTLF
ncbi:tetratricopeptide repeat protein [Candidatus Gracilibacteria bacterium]|nr:tetratricopeptide repeat protein [Candidatus Gracilibacteria bacterium]